MKKNQYPKVAFIFFVGAVASFNNENFLAQAEEKAENQYYCSLGEVYKSKNDKCVSIFEEEKKFPKNDKLIVENKKITTVVYSVKAKRGEGCVALTKFSPKPLKVSECIALARENGRRVTVTLQSGKKSSNTTPNIWLGETWFLIKRYEGNQETLEWIIPQKENTKE